MGLILSEPIKKVVEVLKILSKMSVEDAKIHQKRPYQMLPLPLPSSRTTRRCACGYPLPAPARSSKAVYDGTMVRPRSSFSFGQVKCRYAPSSGLCFSVIIIPLGQPVLGLSTVSLPGA
jgi:hypothetical protein